MNALKSLLELKKYQYLGNDGLWESWENNLFRVLIPAQDHSTVMVKHYNERGELKYYIEFANYEQQIRNIEILLSQA